MINEPTCIIAKDFQTAWLQVVRSLEANSWELRNLIVHIKDINLFNQHFHDDIESFARENLILSPKQVAYTIFPHRLYENLQDGEMLYTAYNRRGGLYDRIRTGWGTYFRRMTNYEGASGTVNQLNKIISAIRNRSLLRKAAYTIVIQHPGGETTRPLGGPCLNYLAIQADPARAGLLNTLGLLAVYRNHDFLERAYGNYWGLTNLLRFIAAEAEGTPGPLTCVSSHAYVSGKKVALRAFMGKF